MVGMNTCSNWKLNVEVFLRLIQRDMRVFLPTLRHRTVNAMLVTVLWVYVFEYVGFGSVTGFGLFIAAGECAITGFFEVMENVSRLVADIKGPRSITYALTLPLPQWMVFARIAVSNALQAMGIAFMILPTAKVLLWNQFSLVDTSYVKVLIIFFLAYMFYGFFSLWLASMVKGLESLGNVWSRIIFPLWFLGCYQFTWGGLAVKSKLFAYVSLLNPLVYCTEGMRAAVIGQDGYLPFWWCCLAIIGFTVFVGVIGTHRMMRRLDCL